MTTPPTKKRPKNPTPLDPAFLRKLESEIENGLPNEQARRGVCLRTMDYYRKRGAKFVPRRPAETEADYANRIKRSLPLVHRVVRVLARLYAQPPSRTIEGKAAASKWLDEVYAAVQADVLWLQADRMAHLHGMCAIQVGATGDPNDPLRLHLWEGWHEIIPFEAPGKANEVATVVTIDRYDQQTTYTWWTPEFYRTYRTEKLKPGQTSGGRIARFVPEESGENPYGCLPFACIWYETPTSGIDEQEGLGPFLADLNAGIDVELSDMAQAVSAYHAPVPIAYECDERFNPLHKPNGWIRVNSEPVEIGQAPTPRLEYLQAKLDVEAGWENVRQVVDSELEALGVPLTAYRMDSRTLPSGAALIAEQKPLLDYARERRPLFVRAEADLAGVCLTVAGSYYGRSDLTAAARDLELTLGWPSPTLDLPSTERDQLDETSLSLGLESRVMIVMRRFGLNRKQALAHLKQVADDEAETTPEPKPEPEPKPTPPDRSADDVDDGPDDDLDDEDDDA